MGALIYDCNNLQLEILSQMCGCSLENYLYLETVLEISV